MFGKSEGFARMEPEGTADPAVEPKFAEAKADTQRAKLRRYAEGYALWARRGSSPCPSTLMDLAQYSGQADTKDVWGNELVWFCGENLPAGARDFAVMSVGPDGQQGTGDDIRSWE